MGCFIANIARNEDLENKYNLRHFHMLYVCNLKTNDVKLGSNIGLSMEYLRYFCKADMSKIGIVSITNNNNLKIPGIEPFVPELLKYGIQKQNILIRTDVEEVVRKGEGDGFWRHLIDYNLEGPSYSVQFPLTTDADIKDYNNKNLWLELAECGLGDSTNSFKSVAFGVERIEYAMFGLPYPFNN